MHHLKIPSMLCAIAIILLPTFAHAATVNIRYDMDVNPLDTGNWTFWSTPGGSSSVSDGILTINSTGFYGLRSTEYQPGRLTANVGWSLETRARVLKYGYEDYMSAGVWVGDSPGVDQVGLFEGEAGMYYPQRMTVPIDTSEFHIYKYDVLDNHVDFYIDNEHVGNWTLDWIGGGTQTFDFGDLGLDDPTVSEWDYISLTYEEIAPPVPVPASAWLFASALIGFASFKRKQDKRALHRHV